MPIRAKENWLGLSPCPPGLNPDRANPIVALADSITTGTTVAVAATATAGQAETYDVSVNNVLTMFYSFDASETTPSYRSFSVTLTGATPDAATTDELVALLNANTMFASLFVADKSTTSLRITMKKVGPDGAFYIGGTANTPLAFTQVSNATKAVGTGTVATLSVTVKDNLGNPMPNAPVTLTLYQADSGDTADASASVCTIVAGNIVSGMFTNTVNLLSNQNGEIEVEIADTTSGSSATYAEFSSTLTGLTCPGMGRTAVTTGT